MKKYLYTTCGTCSKAILLTVEGDTLTDAAYLGGCQGNTQGICRLVVGMHLQDIVKRLKGIRCGSKPTSCPDQLAIALEMIEKGELGDNLKELNDEPTRNQEHTEEKI